MSEQERIRLLTVALTSLLKHCGDGYVDRCEHTAMVNAGAVLRNLGTYDFELEAFEPCQIDELFGNVYQYGVWQSHLVAELKATCVLSSDESGALESEKESKS